MKTLTCFSCDKELENLSNTGVHPDDGIYFSSRGNYGSRIFDPMITPETLEIVICDECLVSKTKSLYGTGTSIVHKSIEYWKSQTGNI